MRLIKAILLLGLVVALAWGSDEERKLEAAFLGRFASYIDWEAKSKEYFIITLIDENPFGSILNNLYIDKRIKGKPVLVRLVRKVEEIGLTDLLFITLNTQKDRLEAIRYAQEHSILSISESRGFAGSGGIIQLNFVDQKIRITINHDAATRSGIKIASPLLSVATVLQRGKP
ncbi:YfiR family protein [Sulfurospirillum oryzae]|uniref:YfiR family protein n=1 Tax=Sulfurospirillum oryzae TaxID=2976535 RepID=UPI0021E7E28E|nr:YfiR family protein [Sulfurospirillum oryzae]